MTLTNQELIQELQKRVKEGTLVAETTVDQFEKTTNSLLSRFGSKELFITHRLNCPYYLSCFV